jgi:uncharacterized membrane protein YgcG
MMKSPKHSFAFVLCCSLLFASADQVAFADQGDQSAAPPPAQAAQQTSEQVQQLVAPIALYPDPLVAQILAASTYPAQVVEAWRWMQEHSGLKGQQLADAVDPQPWDPSVKALTQFRSVLDNMTTNLSWTSALGDAYVNEQEDVFNAVQLLRERAKTAGSLQSTSQQTVTTEGQTIVVEPADPQVVYVPAYDPWLVYGDPLVAYPGWVGVPGIFYDGPDLYFGTGFGVGLFAGFGWGWNDWGFDWHNRRMTYNHAPYISHSRTFVNRHAFDQGGAHFDHGGAHLDRTATFHGGSATFHGGSPERAPAFHVPAAGAQIRPGAYSGAFSGFDHGGIVRGYASRGRSSFGGGFNAGGFRSAGLQGGGGFHGGGGSHGGGSHGGGGHR